MLTAKGVTDNFAPDLTSDEKSVVLATQGGDTRRQPFDAHHQGRVAYQAQLVRHLFQRSNDRARTRNQHGQENECEDPDPAHQPRADAYATPKSRRFPD
jgi:hypothetical protein